MITEKKSANAIGGKTVRACDSCIRRRARWYCAADDAFLCQACDSSVHSANQLASRHERVRLGISSLKDTVSEGCLDANSMPSWHQGFTRKARTPRHAKPMTLGQLHPSTKDDEHEEKLSNTFPLVPEIGSEEASLLDDNEEQLLYRVPVFDPFDSELCKVSSDTEKTVGDESKGLSLTDYGRDGSGEVDNLHGFLLPSDMDLAEFAADVESLLGRGLDEDYSDIKGLGLFDSKEEDGIDVCFGNKRVKIENEEEEIMEGVLECELEMRHETLDWNFDYESPAVTGEGEEEEEEKVVVGMAETARIMSGRCEGEYSRWKMSLKLNHEAVIAAWASQGSPWTTGIRPEFNPDDCWHDFMGLSPTDVHHPYVEVGGGGGGHVGGCDKGREARVSRYREKRRTRLFSKKIRYEVRKLNAEKRPRMKGRFVKRTSFAGPAFTYLNK